MLFVISSHSDRLEHGFSEDDRNQAECHSTLYVVIPDDEIQVLLRHNAACETDSKLNYSSIIREARWYGTISPPQCLVNTPAGCRFFSHGIWLNPLVG